jgi:alcohol dehydrogenase
VLDLRQKTGVPHTLAGLKVDASKREQIAEMAIVDPTAGSNPVPLTREGALKIFDTALAGSL